MRLGAIRCFPKPADFSLSKDRENQGGRPTHYLEDEASPGVARGAEYRILKVWGCSSQRRRQDRRFQRSHGRAPIRFTTLGDADRRFVVADSEGGEPNARLCSCRRSYLPHRNRGPDDSVPQQSIRYLTSAVIVSTSLERRDGRMRCPSTRTRPCKGAATEDVHMLGGAILRGPQRLRSVDG